MRPSEILEVAEKLLELISSKLLRSHNLESLVSNLHAAIRLPAQRALLVDFKDFYFGDYYMIRGFFTTVFVNNGVNDGTPWSTSVTTMERSTPNFLISTVKSCVLDLVMRKSLACHSGRSEVGGSCLRLQGNGRNGVWSKRSSRSS